MTEQTSGVFPDWYTEPDTSVESLQQPSPYLVVPSVATNETQASEVLTSEVLIALTAAQVVEIERACKAIEKTAESSFVFAVEARELLQAVACIRRALKRG